MEVLFGKVKDATGVAETHVSAALGPPSSQTPELSLGSQHTQPPLFAGSILQHTKDTPSSSSYCLIIICYLSQQNPHELSTLAIIL